MTLPIEIQKQITRTCLYSGCHDPADVDSDYCGPHDAHERGRAAKRQRRHRQKLADAWLCIAGCGRKVPKQKGESGKARPRRCSKCRKLHSKKVSDEREKQRAKLCVTGDGCGVTGDADDPAWRVDPGTNWIRYRGKGRRGRLTREEQAAEDKRNAMFAIEALQEFIKRVDRYVGLQPHELSPVQRNEAKRQTGEPLGLAGRFIDELVEHYG